MRRSRPRLLGSYPLGGMEPDLFLDILGLIMREEMREKVRGELGERERERLREGFYVVRYPKDAIFSETYSGRYFVCYFSGEELGQLVGIILNPDERPDPYRGALVRSALRLFRRREIPTTEEEWSALWNMILLYPNLPLEQRIADIFRDLEARVILSVMINEGVTTVDDLVRKVRERLSAPTTRDLIISYIYVLSALGILEVRYDERALVERVYLISDVVFYRKKPPNFKDIVRKVPEYAQVYSDFVSEYLASWEVDMNVIPEVIGDPETYAFVERLRREGVINIYDISDEEKKIIEKLVDIRIVKIIGDNICLLSDPALKLLFPKWTIRGVLERAEKDEGFRDVVIAWLNVLREAYLRRR